MRLVVGVILGVLAASSAQAQSTYVGASFIGDVVRVSGPNGIGPAGDGETFGGALRLGAPLGEHFGVEVEFARTGEIDATPPFSILAQQGFTFGSSGSGSLSFVTADDPAFPLIFPPVQIESERQLTTISTLLWWNHAISSRLSLAYLGGVSFTRTMSMFRATYQIPPRFPNLPAATFPTLREQETVEYGADVVVGFEARLGMTDHVRLVPGVRLQTAPGGWAVRPGVGLQWAF